ncbi:MAG: LytTR family DNA-binding domain-containing protein [Bacteroidota bacterium]
MQTLIVEDNLPAGDHLQGLLGESFPHWDVLPRAGSLVRARELYTERKPELVFLDVDLPDGSSLELLRGGTFRCPVIITTGHPEYSLDAFDWCTVDFLLKPISPASLLRAVGKVKEWEGYGTPTPCPAAPAYRQSLLVPQGHRQVPIPVSQVAFIVGQRKHTYVHTLEGGVYHLSTPLGHLEASLHPRQFFRINRQYVVNRSAVLGLEPYFNGQQSMYLAANKEAAPLVSKNRVQKLISWLEYGCTSYPD